MVGTGIYVNELLFWVSRTTLVFELRLFIQKGNQIYRKKMSSALLHSDKNIIGMFSDIIECI